MNVQIGMIGTRYGSAAAPTSGAILLAVVGVVVPVCGIAAIVVAVPANIWSDGRCTRGCEQAVSFRNRQGSAALGTRANGIAACGRLLPAGHC